MVLLNNDLGGTELKVIGICGSSREDGNTYLIMNIVFRELEAHGIETKLIQLANRNINPCKGCFACKDKNKCVFGQDAFNECFDELIRTDGILLGSPVYSADVTARMKAFLERAGVVVAMNPGLLKHKVGASVTAVRRGGGLASIDTMNHFLLNKEVFVVGSTYWNMVYGKEAGDVLKDDEGISNMKNLGQNMAWLLKQLKVYH